MKSDADSSGGLGRAVAALALMLAVFCAQGVLAQSGRKAPKVSTTPPQSAPAEQGESESGPKQGAAKKPDTLVNFVVMSFDDAVAFGIDPLARDGVADNFLRRLGQSSAVSVTSAGKGRRQDARARAKTESSSYVVLFEMEDDRAMGGGGVGPSNPAGLVIKTYVYAPKTGDLKYTDTIYQRPYRQTARVGGVRIPVPSRGIERYPSQRELEQAARDAADRVLARFNISPPSDN